jgi:hypothetical protein
MKGSFKFKGNVPGDLQEEQFQNATQTTLGSDERSIAIAVTPAFPEGFDVLDKDAVEAFMAERMQPLVDAGFQVEVQYGRFSSY